MRNPLIVGGASGIGLALAHLLATQEDTETVWIVDRNLPTAEQDHPKFRVLQFDLTHEDYSIFNQFPTIDGLFITAGFARLALFKDIDEAHLVSSFQVNALAPLRIVHHFYDRLQQKADFPCAIMVSIAGFLSSPFYAVYGATKAALRSFIESVNVELSRADTPNRILNVSPGHFSGSQFEGGTSTQLDQLFPLAQEILSRALAHNDLYIPQYDEVFHAVLDRYQADFRKEGQRAYDYKLQSGRVKN